MSQHQPTHTTPVVWHVGGEDVHMRIPLLLRLRAMGFHVAAVGSQSHPDFAAHEISFLHYPLPQRAHPLGDIQAGRALRRLFAEHRPDVVHAFDTRPAILAPLSAAKEHVPARIRTITGMGRLFASTSLSASPLRLAYRTLQRRVSADCLTVFQNQDDRDYFLHHHMVPRHSEALVQGSGVDVEQIATAAGDPARVRSLQQEYALRGKLVVTLIARLIPEKGIREFLVAAQSIAHRRSDAQFLLVGPGSTEGRKPITEREISAAAPAVRYLGRRSDIPAILGATHVFVLPTYYREGVPRVLLEAGALGIPLITTDAPGCRDVVSHEQQGLIVPPRDTRALEHAITRLLDSPRLRRSLGDACQKHVHRYFSLATVADHYCQLYLRQLAAA